MTTDDEYVELTLADLEKMLDDMDTRQLQKKLTATVSINLIVSLVTIVYFGTKRLLHIILVNGEASLAKLAQAPKLNWYLIID